MKKARTVALLVFSLLFMNSFLFAQSMGKTLFKIERNKNANIVVYDVRLTADENIDKYNPIDAYWVMNAKQGQREEITAFEKKAYGYTITYNSDGSYDLVLNAVSNRTIKVANENGEFKAKIIINGKKAYLSSVYVFAKDGLIPKVSYFILTGTYINTDIKVTERIKVS